MLKTLLRSYEITFSELTSATGPIGTKFNTETSAQVAHSPANLWRPPTNGRKWRRKQERFPDFFSVTKTTHGFTHFPAVKI